ncbi:MAG: flagellar hook capping FlgD N-terminal domain-containing protein [Rhodanobacter sp.]
MTTINTNNNTAASPPATSSSAAAMAGGMSQSDFLQLMTAQLKAQDPTNPVDNSQFVSQMAQFSQLSATQDLLTSVNGLSSTVGSALQSSQVVGSSNLINRQVMVPSSTVDYAGSSVTGAVNAGGATNATVNILDASGKSVRTINLSAQGGGLAQFSWDGKDNNGNPLASGTYSIAANNNGSALDTYVAGTVTSVGYGGGTIGTYLQVAGVGGVPLSQVAQIL